MVNVVLFAVPVEHTPTWSGVGDVVAVIRRNLKEHTKQFNNFLIYEIGQCERPSKEVDDKRAEPLEGISKFHSIWVSSTGEIRGQELSCEICSISERCVNCNEGRMKKKSKSVDKFKCPFCPKMYVHKKTFEKYISTHE